MSVAGDYKDIWKLLKAKKRIVLTPHRHTRKQMVRAISKEKDEDPEKNVFERLKCTEQLRPDGTWTGNYVLELVEVQNKYRGTTLNKLTDQLMKTIMETEG